MGIAAFSITHAFGNTPEYEWDYPKDETETLYVSCSFALGFFSPSLSGYGEIESYSGPSCSAGSCSVFYNPDAYGGKGEVTLSTVVSNAPADVDNTITFSIDLVWVGDHQTYHSNKTFSLKFYSQPKALNVSPADGEDNVNPVGSILLMWLPGIDTVQNRPQEYRVYLYSEFSSEELIYQGTSTQSSIDSPGLAIFGNLWRVDCLYKIGEDDWGYDVFTTRTGDEWSFDTSLTFIILPPVNIAPVDGSTDVSPSSVTLEWQDPNLQGAFVLGPVIKYAIFINGEKALANIPYQGEFPTTIITGLKYNTTYTWRVVIVTSMVNSFGTEWTFTTKTVGAGAGGGPPLPTGRNAGTRVQHLIAAADDTIWYET
jgi:hypothetical protein